QVINTISDTSNLMKLASRKFKLLEDKEIHIFLDSKSKKKDTSTESEKTIISSSLYNTKAVTKYYNFNNFDTSSEKLKLDDQIIE
ncbi:669_t:CDS:2, partial [Diversispora eburnea]